MSAQNTGTESQFIGSWAFWYPTTMFYKISKPKISVELPWRVVGDDLLVVVPEDVRWRLRGVRDEAGQVDHRLLHNVHVGGALDTYVRN